MSFPLQIEGVDLPAPSGYKFNEADIVTNADRNDAGYANWDVVRFNVGRLDLTWENVSRDKIVQIVSAIRNKQKFRCTFLNLNTGEVETREFYSGDRANELVKYVSALDYWASLTIPFIEV
jgi:hypothetical protein